jgi:hypothetical protein
MKLFLPSGPEVWKFFLRDVIVSSGFFIRMTGTIPNIELRFYLLQDPLDNGQQPYYAFTRIPDLMSIVPNLFDVEHEWRFEHKILTGDPDGYAETEIYCDNVLLKREKINLPGTSSAQKLIGFNQGTGPDNIYSLQLGNIGTKVSYIIINEKPLLLPPPPTLLEVDFLQNSQNRFQSLGLADSVVTTSSQSFNFNADNQLVTLSDGFFITIKPSNWGALVPAIQNSFQLKLKLFLPLGDAIYMFQLEDAGDLYSGPSIRLFGSYTSPELRCLLKQERSVNGNGNYSYYLYMSITNIISLVPNLFNVEHEWRFESKKLIGDPDGYAEAGIYCDDVLLKREKINNVTTGTEQRAIGFNQGTGVGNRYNLLLGKSGTKVSHIIINGEPV